MKRERSFQSIYIIFKPVRLSVRPSVCPSVCLSAFCAAKLQAIVILEAYTKGNKNPKSLRSQLQRCGFARPPTVSLSIKNLIFFIIFFSYFFLLFLGNFMMLSQKNIISKSSQLCQTTNGWSKHQKKFFILFSC